MRDSADEMRVGSGLVARLRAHVVHLAGTIGERHQFRPQALEAARAYVEAELRGAGHAVTPQWYEAAGVRVANLEAAVAGARWPEQILVVGAHYDSVPGSPGADDNASAVAALIEIARAFSARTPAITVRFVAFANEEPPFFRTRSMGSVVYARACRARHDDVRLMVSLEMLGCYSDEVGSQRYPPLFAWFHPDRANFVGIVSDLRSRALARRLETAFRRHSDFPIERSASLRIVPGVSWSDHWAFWRQGYQALMVTDTAFYRNANYHTARDTPETLDYPSLACVTDGLSQAFATLADEGFGR